MSVAALRACWSLYKTSSEKDTYIAFAVAAVVLAPVAAGLWRRWR